VIWKTLRVLATLTNKNFEIIGKTYVSSRIYSKQTSNPGLINNVVAFLGRWHSELVRNLTDGACSVADAGIRHCDHLRPVVAHRVAVARQAFGECRPLSPIQRTTRCRLLCRSDSCKSKWVCWISSIRKITIKNVEKKTLQNAKNMVPLKQKLYASCSSLYSKNAILELLRPRFDHVCLR